MRKIIKSGFLGVRVAISLKNGHPIGGSRRHKIKVQDRPTGPERSAQKPFHRKQRTSETDAMFIDKKQTKCLQCGSRHDHSGALGSPIRLYGHGQQYDLARSCRLRGFWVTEEFYTRDFLNYDMVSGGQHRAG